MLYNSYYERRDPYEYAPATVFAKSVGAFFIIFFLLSLWAMVVQYAGPETNIVVIDTSNIRHITGKYFVSFTLDTDNVYDDLRSLEPRNPKLIKLASYLAPAYLRIGGNLADQLFFIKSDAMDERNYNSAFCSNFTDNFTMNIPIWKKLNNFTKNIGMEMIFDLNVLIRDEDGSWNSSNAEELIDFSASQRLNLHWELGNEPNSFFHKYNRSVNATQLARDFDKLRQILNNYDIYRDSLLLGPSTTSKLNENSSSNVYFKEFVEDDPTVSVFTWHQYYLNGRNTSLYEFLDLKTFEMLEVEIREKRSAVLHSTLKHIPIWLGETSSAYGCGAPNLSNTFVGSFLWLDKLGLSAKLGLNTVIRQSLFGGYYALLDENHNPNPDWWVSIFYKSYVGHGVLNCLTATERKLRIYCHCTAEGAVRDRLQGITVFGINLNRYSVEAQIKFFESNLSNSRGAIVFEYILTGVGGLYSREVALNGEPLRLLADNELPPFKPRIKNLNKKYTLPAYSIVFWVIHGIDFPICEKLKLL